MIRTTLGSVLVVALLAAAPSMAQEVSQAHGTILDREGNPIPGALVTFQPVGEEKPTYSAKTNKKGKYFTTGMWTPDAQYRWQITLEAEGYSPVHIVVESRNVNKVLIGDLDQKIKANAKIPEFRIRPLGKARVDLTVALTDVVQAEAAAEAVASAAAAAGVELGEDGEPVEPETDPWTDALTLAQDGKYEASLPLFAEAIEDEPEDAERYETYAKVLYELERYDEAVAQAQKVIELDPDRLDARKVAASAYLEDGDFDRAREALEAAIERAPEDVSLFERLAYVASQGGDDEGAITAYEKITTVDPENASAWVALGGMYHAAGRSGDSEAAYQKVVELDPGSSYQTFFNIGVLIMKRDSRSETDTRRAIDAFRKSVEIKPDYAQGFQQLAFALLGVGDQDGAADALESYLKASPNAADADRMRGLIKTLAQ